MLSLFHTSLTVGVLGLLLHGGSAARAEDTIDLRRAYTMHPTKFVNLTPFFTVKNGSKITLYAQLLYQKKDLNWAPLTDKSVQVEFRAGPLGKQGGTVWTDKKTGLATISFTYTHPNRIPPSGVSVGWTVAYPGDGTTFRPAPYPTRGSPFTVTP